LAECTRQRRWRSILVGSGQQLRYILFVTGLAAIVALALGLLIVEQSHFASEQIILALTGDAAAWLDDQARSAVIAQLGRTDVHLAATLAVIGVVLLLVVVLALLWMTHRVAGPLHRMAGYFASLQQGRLVAPGQLRRGDQFQEVFASLRMTHEAICERARLDVAVMSEAVAAAQGIEAPSPELEASLRALQELVAEKSASLPE